MENNGNELIDARRVAVVMREMTLDVTRAFLTAVPAALRAEKFAPEQVARLTSQVCREAEGRFIAGVSATIATLENL
jgi:hypothetical protein